MTVISREGIEAGISTRFSFFSRIAFALPGYNKLFHDTTYAYLSLSPVQIQRWETQFIAETEFKREQTARV